MSHLNFTWDSVTTLTDGTVTNHSMTYNLYENGVKVVSDIAATNFSLLMDGKATGSYTYTVTAVDTSDGLESAQSAPVEFNFQLPKSPENLAFTFTAS